MNAITSIDLELFITSLVIDIFIYSSRTELLFRTTEYCIIIFKLRLGA
jgi:hypothetical protein